MSLDSSGVTPNRDRYTVTFTFREPTFELWHGARAQPFRFSVDIAARNQADALSLANAEFRALARDSNVAWVRQVLHTDIQCLGPERREAAEQGRAKPLSGLRMERRRGRA